MERPTLATNTPGLESICAHVKETGVAALDTEFVSRGNYRQKLCLVQVAADGASPAAIDCFQGFDSAPFARVMEDASVVKILHDSTTDLVLLRWWTGVAARNVFDTQLAAAFAGFRAGIGLGQLLEGALGVGLAKTETLTDWTQRPLTPAQIEYALDDVRHLPALRVVLLSKAEEFGTLEWMMEDMAALEAAQDSGDAAPQDAWRRIRCIPPDMSRRALARLRALAAVRERKAREWDMARSWLADDRSLVEIAEAWTPGAGRCRFRNRLRNEGERELLAAAFLAAMEETEDLGEDMLPEPVAFHYAADVVEAAGKAEIFLRELAGIIHVDAAAIAGRSTLRAFIDNPDDASNPLASGWRHEVAGSAILELYGIA